MELKPARIQVVVVVVLAVTAVVLGGGENIVTLSLERVSPSAVELSQLRERDLIRHGRILQQRLSGVVDLPVEGTYDPFILGLYYTRVQLGTPPKEFYVQIDTGSDVLWVSCNSCNGCPKSSGLQIHLDSFDHSSSSTAELISCSDQRCALGKESSDSSCLNQNQCGYTFQYGDGSGASGYYVSDLMYFDTIVGDSSISNSSAPVVFGCSTSQTGALMKSDKAVNGIFGFGQQGLSVISQLFSQGVIPNVFSHCLKGDDDGGGILVLGQIVEPNIVYTPLVPSLPHYNINLESISVKGQKLPIDPSVFATANNRGTIVDSGTTLAYLADEAYDLLVSAIRQAVSPSARPLLSKGNQCYLSTSREIQTSISTTPLKSSILSALLAVIVFKRVSEAFPPVSLNFAGGASMILKPENYLLQQNSIAGAAVWCIGLQKIQGSGITILGDLVLKDKIVVYDLAGQQIGWTEYDCSSSVNVSTTTNNGKTEFVNAGEIDNSSSSVDHYNAEPMALAAFLLRAFWIFVFL